MKRAEITRLNIATATITRDIVLDHIALNGGAMKLHGAYCQARLRVNFAQVLKDLKEVIFGLMIKWFAVTVSNRKQGN